jgi:hypothetical protein
MPSLRDRWRRIACPGSTPARAELIDRKTAVQAEAASVRSEIARLRGDGVAPGRLAQLEAQLSRLLAEESALRIKIDRTRQ